MASLYLTDSEVHYTKSTHENKVLVGGAFFRFVKDSDFLSLSELQTINESFTQLRLLEGDHILADIGALAKRIEVPNFPYIAKNQNPELGLSHLLFRDFVERKHFLTAILKRLISLKKWDKIHLELTEAYLAFTETNFNGIPLDITWIKETLKKQALTQRIKNKVYFLFDLRRSLRNRLLKKEKKRVVFLMQTAQHHHELIKDLYRRIREVDKYEFLVVSYPLDLGDPEKFKEYLPSGTTHFPIQHFRGSTKFRLKKSIGNGWPVDLASIEANYTMMHNMIEYLKPDICVTVGYLNPGRYLSDVSRYFDVPSISIDYSFITDDYTFEKEIEYDHKCTISTVQKDVWKKRNDPSHNHVVTGYLKYDQIKEDLNQEELITRYGLKKGQFTVFFASSHGYDPEAKKEVLRQLSTLCKSLNWNLVVKTHPLEDDGIAKSVINEKQQVALSHNEISAMEAVFLSDVVVSQGSSIVLDALYYLKPFVTFSFSDDLVITDFMPISDEPFVFKSQDIASLENQLKEIMSKRNELQKQMEKVRADFLFETDGKAHQRVYNLINELV